MEFMRSEMESRWNGKRRLRVVTAKGDTRSLAYFGGWNAFVSALTYNTAVSHWAKSRVSNQSLRNA